jgi:transposase-like protein
MTIKMIDLGWAAGFLEGEGSMCFPAHKDIRVMAWQVQRAPLDKLHDLFGGNVLAKKTLETSWNRQPLHYWSLGGSRAAALMMTLYPLMSPKRQGEMRKTLQGWRERGAKFGEYHYSSIATDDSILQAMQRVLDGERVNEVARSIGVHHSILSQWMTGKTRSYLQERLNGTYVKRPVNASGEENLKVTVNDAIAYEALYRVHHGETMNAVAKSLGIAQITVSRWCSGQNRPYLLARLQQEDAQVVKEE